MLRSRLSLIFLVVIVLGANHSCALRPKSSSQEQTPEALVKTNLPPPNGLINDFANVFEPEAKARLEALLTQLNQNGNIAFAVVTVETTNGQPIFDYSLALAREWKVGSKNSGGLLLMLAVKDRKWWIQVSRGLENDLPDSLCKQLGEQSTDLYKSGRYSDGIEKFVRAIIARLEQTRSFRLPRT
jgi:uncharacterized protein